MFKPQKVRNDVPKALPCPSCSSNGPNDTGRVLGQPGTKRSQAPAVKGPPHCGAVASDRGGHGSGEPARPHRHALLDVGIDITPHQLSNVIARLRRQREDAPGLPEARPAPTRRTRTSRKAAATADRRCPGSPAFPRSRLFPTPRRPTGSASKFGAHDPRLLDEVMRSTPDMKALAKLAPKQQPKDQITHESLRPELQRQRRQEHDRRPPVAASPERPGLQRREPERRCLQRWRRGGQAARQALQRFAAAAHEAR
jgi:hypothetical protein